MFLSFFLVNCTYNLKLKTLNNKKIHFEVSERKILLKVFDLLFVLFSLWLVSYFFDFKYFRFSTANFYWTLVLALYLNVFGSVFEMYNLQVASSQFQIIRSIILTTCTTVLIYILTPIYTPFLPSNRLQIVIFFISIFSSLLLWRIFYVKFLASHRFVKKVILVCDKDQLEELVLGLVTVDPHYKIIAYVNSDGVLENDIINSSIIPIPLTDLEIYVRNNNVSEIVIASRNTEAITVDLSFSSGTLGIAPSMLSWRALLLATKIKSKRFVMFSKQSSTVILAIGTPL